MLVGKTERRDIPHESGNWMEFRQLSGLELDEAEAAAMLKALALVKGLDAGAMATLQAQAGAQEQEQSHDKDTLVCHGIAAWSYPEPCDEENKRKLDAVTRDWAAAVILEMNVRSAGEGHGSGENSHKDGFPLNSPEPISSAASE